MIFSGVKISVDLAANISSNPYTPHKTVLVIAGGMTPTNTSSVRATLLVEKKIATRITVMSGPISILNRTVVKNGFEESLETFLEIIDF